MASPPTPGEVLYLLEQFLEHVREAPVDGVPASDIALVAPLVSAALDLWPRVLEGDPDALELAHDGLSSAVTKLVDLRARCGTALRRTQWLEGWWME
jgi:hypothetical protein